MTRAEDPQLREALDELELYLADQLAPLLVAGAVEQLLARPPALTGELLARWAFEQASLRPRELAAAELLFHALRKVHQLHELGLVTDPRFLPFLRELAADMLQRCPPEQRERLAGLIAQLGAGAGAGRARTPVAGLTRFVPAATGPPPAAGTTPPPLSAAALASLQRFADLLEKRFGAGGPAPADAASSEAAQQLLVLAAADAGNAEELSSRLARLQTAGLGPALERDLLRNLIPTLPDWAVVRPEGASATPQGGAAAAVEHAVRLAGDRARTAERWKELVQSAAEEFNQGAFGRALTLVDLAARMARDGEVDPQLAARAFSRAHEAYDTAMLLQAAAESRHRPLLRRLLEIHPGWAPRELLDALDQEPDSKRRRLLLTLLEVWGREARPIVFERLGLAIAAGAREANAWWFLRNLVFLLRRLPREPGSDPRQELELIGPFTSLDWHPSFQRESLLLLAQLPDGLGLPLLVERLRQAEKAAAATPPARSPEDLARVFQALAHALVHQGSAEGRRALVEHALARRPGTGDSLARLRELGRIDLANDPPVLARLLAELQELIPRRVLGFVVRRRDDELALLVTALAATTAPAARAALADLAARFPETTFGRLAAAGGKAAPAPVVTPEDGEEDEEEVPATPVPEPERASLTGDLDLFGLPGLLQNLQQTEATGRLLVRDADGQLAAEMRLVGGRFASCRSGRLCGEAALYQLLELPFPGSFEFTRTSGAAPPPPGDLRDLLGLLLESMRRHDELRRARALVPDDALLRAGGARPTAPETERDGELVRTVWARVRGGARARDCDEVAPVDLYRIRTLLAHWVGEGALEIAPEPAAP